MAGVAHRAAGVCALAVLALGAGARPAHAVVEQRVVSPQEAARLTEAVDIVAEVRPAPGEEIQQVEARLVHGGQPLGEPHPLDLTQAPTESTPGRWASRLDPLASWASGGAAMPNGDYRIEIRARTTVSTGDWTGHGVRFVVAPPVPDMSIATDDTGIRADWRAADVPDFRSATLERATADGGFTAVARTNDPAVRTLHDPAPPADSPRYRLVVARVSGEGGEVTATSAEAAPAPPAAEGEPTAAPATTAAAPQAPGQRPAAPGPPARRPAAPPPQSQPTTFASILPLPSGAAVASPPPVPVLTASPTVPAAVESLAPDAQREGDDLASADPPGALSVREEGADMERFLAPLAAGLVLTLGGLHLLRFRVQGSGRRLPGAAGPPPERAVAPGPPDMLTDPGPPPPRPRRRR